MNLSHTVMNFLGPVRRRYAIVLLSAFGVLLGTMASYASANADDVWLSGANVKVELKSWIPFHHVVDPSSPLSFPFDSPVLDAPKCFDLPRGTRGTTYKAFRGDGHDLYDGGYRTIQTLTFEAKPYVFQRGRNDLKVTNIHVTSDVSPTHLDRVWEWHDQQRSCTLETKTAENASSGGELTDRGIRMSLAAANPIQFGSPAANADAYVYPEWGGADGEPFDNLYPDAIDIKYRTDRFPSIGIKVEVNGGLYAKVIVNDASCIRPVTGPAGSKQILKGLLPLPNMRPASQGSLKIGAPHYVYWYNPLDNGTSNKALGLDARAKSGLCTNSYDALF